VWKAFRGRGVPDFFLKLLEDLHSHTAARVRITRKLSDRFITTSGVRQGCVLAPILFKVAVDWVLSHLAQSVGINVDPHQFTDLAYADDDMPDEAQVNDTLQNFRAAAAPVGLKVSVQAHQQGRSNGRRGGVPLS